MDTLRTNVPLDMILRFLNIKDIIKNRPTSGGHPSLPPHLGSPIFLFYPYAHRSHPGSPANPKPFSHRNLTQTQNAKPCTTPHTLSNNPAATVAPSALSTILVPKS